MMDVSRDLNGGTGMIANPPAQTLTEVGEVVAAVVVVALAVPAEVVDTTIAMEEATTIVEEEAVDTIMIAVEDTIVEEVVEDTTMIAQPMAVAVDGENGMIEVLRQLLLLLERGLNLTSKRERHLSKENP